MLFHFTDNCLLYLFQMQPNIIHEKIMKNDKDKLKIDMK